MEEIPFSYGGDLVAERLAASGAQTTNVYLSYVKGGDISDPAVWNTLSITGEYNGQDFILDCDYSGEGDRKDPAAAYAVTQYGDVEVIIYREESDWSKPFLYRAEFTLDGVGYSLSIHSDEPENIYAWLDIVLGKPEGGEPEGGKPQSGVMLTDVLGFGVCRVEMEEITPGQYMWHFYVKADGKDVCVAEQFGYDEPEAWSRDLNGDGVPELICNSTYGDGVESVIVYRNNNGIIEEGTVRWSYYEEKFGWTHLGEGGISSLPAEKYNPEQGVFTATDYYTNGYDDPVTVEFNDGLEPFDFLPFSHLPR
ncbi:MAG: hypothetical protein NC123_04450 [Butyrivibrio sp.]|nr:hypothetical protein [Butyrivibrio sp.]